MLDELSSVQAKKSVTISAKSKRIKKDKVVKKSSLPEGKKWTNRTRGKTLDLTRMGILPMRTPKPSIVKKEQEP